MRKLKLFFACLLMAVLSIGQVSATGPISINFGTSTGYWAAHSADGTNDTYTDTDGRVWTRTCSVSNRSGQAGYSQFGNASNVCGSLEFYATAGADITVSAFSVTMQGASAGKSPTKGTIKLYKRSGTTDIELASASVNGTDNVTCSITSSASFSSTDKLVVSYAGTAKAIRVTSLSYTYTSAGGTPTCSTPTFSPAAGSYTSAQSVTISCETEGSTIYYTTDGSAPDNTKLQYTGAINVSETQTIKAIAVKEGANNSAIATAAYLILEPQTIAQIMPTATTEGDEFLLNDVTVTYAYGNNVFVKDESGYILIYSSISGAANGKVLQGLQGKAKLYNGLPEISAVTKAPTVTDGSAVAPEALTAYPVAADLNKYVTMEDVTFASAITFSSGSVTNETGKFKGSDLVFRNTFKINASLATGKKYRVVGIVQKYNDNFQIYPISFEEIVVLHTVTYNNAPNHGTLTIKNGDDVVASGSAVNEGTVLDIVTSPAEGYKLKEVQVNGSAYTETTLELTEDVVIAAEFEVNEAPLVTSYVLSEIGVETSHLNGEHVGDKVNLPLTATECSKVFRGWDTDENCATEPTYAPGAEITLAANNKFYAVYADAHVVTPTDHALGSATFLGSATGGNTASEGYEFSKSTKGDNKAGYIQDSGTKDATIVFLQIKAESQIINEEPSAIILTAHLGAGSDKDPLDYPVYAVLVDADNNNVGDPVVLTTAIPKAGDDFSVELPTANYADVRGVKISHMKEDGWNVRYYSMSFKYQTGGTTYDNYSTECQAQVATPVIAGVSPSGVYTEAKEITITCATDGATIYYAVDSDEEPSTEYTGAFTIGTDGAHTVKAKAVKTDMAASEIASVSFTINLPVVLSTIPAIFEAATSTQTEVNIAMDNWVVSGVGTDEKTVYVTDGTNGFIIYNSDHGFAVGDILSGTITCDLKKYKGAAELIGVTTSTAGLSVAPGGTITPAAVAPADLAGVNTGALISLSSWKYDGSNLTNGTTEIQPYTTLYNFGETFVEDNYYNVSGIYLQFDSKKEILPRSADDIEAVSLSDPELSYTPASATITTNDALPGTVFANPHGLDITFSSDNDDVATVHPTTGVITKKTGTGTAVITASFAGNATYAAGYATYTLTVEQYIPAENVVILATYKDKLYAMSTNLSSSAFAAIEVVEDGANIVVTSEDEKAAIQWTKKTSGENFTFQKADGKYLAHTGTGTNFTLQEADTESPEVWTLHNDGYYYAVANRTFLYYKNGTFKNYATSNAGGDNYSGYAEVRVIAAENIVVVVPTTHEVSYNANGGTLISGETAIAPAQVAEGAIVTVAANVYEKEGYLFAGWLYGETVYNAGQNFEMPTTDVELVAQWNEVVVSDYTLVTDLAQLQAGDKVIIVAANYNYAAGTQAGTYREKVEIAKTNDKSHLIFGASMPTEFVLAISENGYMFMDDSRYMYESGEKSVKTQADPFNWSVTVGEDSIATIKATNELRYNSSSPRFTTYASGQQKLQLYRKPAEYSTVRGGLAANRYYTLCFNRTMAAVQGATFWKFASKDANMAYLVQEDAPYAAGTPYIIYAEAAGDLTAVLSGEEEPNAGSNGALHGTFSLMEQSALNDAATAAGHDLYLVIGNELRRATGTGTGNNTLPAYRAYIDLDEIDNNGAPANVPAHRVRAIPMHKDVVTGFENLNATDKPVKMLIDGNIYILRGEKMYDATGRLVK